MHSLLLQFAREKLEQVPLQRKEINNRHCNYFIRYIQERGAGLYGDNPMSAQEEISKEIENIRASWLWAGKQQKIRAIKQTARTMGRYYDMRSWFLEGERVFGSLVSSLEAIIEPDMQTSQALAIITTHQGWFQVQLGNYQTAVELLEIALETLSLQDTPDEYCFALNVMGSAFYELGNFDRAQAYFKRNLSEISKTTQKSEQAFTLNYLGSIARNQGDFIQAKELFNQSLDVYQKLRDQWGLARVLNNLGGMAGMAGNYSEAETIFLESLSIRRELKDLAGVAGCLHNLSNIAYIAKDYSKTQSLRQECLEICREIGFTWGVASTLKHLGDVDKALGDLPLAMQRYAESLEISEKARDRRSVAFTLNSMGNLALIQRNLKGARHYFTEALKTAMEIEVIPLALDILVGIAELSAQEGDSQLAIELLTFTLEHSGTEKQTQEQGTQLKIKIETEKSSDETQSFQRFSNTTSLQEVVNQLV
jgi:tetratricopeptide (TPR) repeat protein